MKKHLILFIIVLLAVNQSFAQAYLNSSAKQFIIDHRHSVTCEDLFNNLVTDYDLIKINGSYHIGVLGLVEEGLLDREKFTTLEIVNDTRLEHLWSMRVPINNFTEFIEIDGIKYIEVGMPVSPYLDEALPSARVDSVHQGIGELSRAYSGKGVIVAIIDWGFDYTHPNFYDTSLNKLRISRAWDQNKLSGPHPHGYSFGTEYVGFDELIEAGSDTLYVFGPSSHGSHVGGIAGGSGGGTEYIGAAYDSELIFISLRRDAPSLVDAFSYITNYAALVNKPYVVNMSFGSHLGPHDGTSLKNLGIDILHGPGKIFVGSAGNNGPRTGNSTFHLDHDFIENPYDTIKTVVEFGNVSDMFGQTLSMWGSANSEFSVSIAQYGSSTSELKYQTPFFNSALEPFVNDTIVFGEDSLIIRIQSTKKHFLNDKPNIRLEVKKTSPHRLVLYATSPNSHLHVWNNVRMNNRYTNWGVSLNDNFPGALKGDNDYALGEPAGVGRNVITVGSYMAEREIGGNLYFGQISSWSSMGPTVDNRTKPDITSVGQNVISSMNSFDSSVSGPDKVITFNDREYVFKSSSGTSMSAPLVTGIVALMLEAHPQLSATQAKEILKNTARLDDNTGEIGSEGDLWWGWGKANALAAVKAAELMSYNNEITINNDAVSVFPNPANTNFAVKNNNNQENIILVEVFSMDGKLIKSVPNNSNSVSINVDDIKKGMYLLRIQTEYDFSVQKLLVN